MTNNTVQFNIIYNIMLLILFKMFYEVQNCYYIIFNSHYSAEYVVQSFVMYMDPRPGEKNCMTTYQSRVMLMILIFVLPTQNLLPL